MKKFVIAGLTLVFAFALVGMLAAQYSKPDSGKTASAKSVPAETSAKAPQKAKSKVAAATALQATGTVVSVDAIGNTVVIKGKKGSATFHVAPDAKLLVGGKAVALGDIGTGSKVTVTYKLEQNALKQTIKVATAIR